MYVHPSSSLFNHTPPIKTVLYYELVMTSKSYMRQVMEIKPAWLMEGTAFFVCCLVEPSCADCCSPPFVVAPHYFKAADLEQLATGDRKMPKAIGSRGEGPAP